MHLVMAFFLSYAKWLTVRPFRYSDRLKHADYDNNMNDYAFQIIYIT